MTLTKADLEKIREVLLEIVREELHEKIDNIQEEIQDLAMRQLEADTHSRKWNLVVAGIEGEKGENDDVTRDKVNQMNNEILKAKPGQFSACHRLSHTRENARIVLRFTDLMVRNDWLRSAKNLKGSKISLGVDLPPALRPLQDELLRIRKEFDTDKRKVSYLKFLPKWPFVQLSMKNEEPVLPSTKKGEILSAYLKGTTQNLPQSRLAWRKDQDGTKTATAPKPNAPKSHAKKK